MKKIHTRQKRRLGVSTHKRQYSLFHTVAKKNRMRTFTTKEAAMAWAEGKGISSYEVQPAKRNKRFRVVISDGKDKNPAN